MPPKSKKVEPKANPTGITTPVTDSTQSTPAKKYWDKDGVNGGKSSLVILLDWVRAHGNYEKWKGGSKHSGISKESLCGEIVGLLKSAGISNRKNADIRDKIGQFESKFKEAVDWLANTGQGVTDENDIDSAVRKRCPWYDELAPIMSERASTRPMITSDDLYRHSIEGGSDGESLLPSETPVKAAAKKRKTVEDQWVTMRETVNETKREESLKKWAFEKQRLELEQRRDEREANSQKLKTQETEANIELVRAQASHAKMTQLVALLESKQALKAKGVSQSDIDLLDQFLKQ